jgi:hypothetical protein
LLPPISTALTLIESHKERVAINERCDAFLASLPKKGEPGFGSMAHVLSGIEFDACPVMQGTISVGPTGLLRGQLHHGISKVIHSALQQHPTLRGLFRVRDPRFVTRASDAFAHRGYQTWHRNLDAEVAGWIRSNPNATQLQFESYMHGLYQRPDLLSRFPGGW